MRSRIQQNLIAEGGPLKRSCFWHHSKMDEAKLGNLPSLYFQGACPKSQPLDLMEPIWTDFLDLPFTLYFFIFLVDLTKEEMMKIPDQRQIIIYMGTILIFISICTYCAIM